MSEKENPIKLIGEVIPYRAVTLDEKTAALYDGFVNGIVARIEAGDDRSDICRDTLHSIYGNGTTELLSAQLDPRRITLEPEYYGDIDSEKYAQVKPLLWLWYMFDRSPLGLNLDLGFRLRAALARFIFKGVGVGFKCFPYVEFTFGYNIEVGDNVVFHRHVFVDDRAGVKIGNHSSLSDYVNVYSHTHDINCRYYVSNLPTIIGNNCRVTYHATVLAGTRMADNSMLGAGGLLTKSTREDAVYVGIPAKKVKEKDPRHHCTPDHHGQGSEETEIT